MMHTPKIGLDVLQSVESELENALSELGEAHKAAVDMAEVPGRVTGAVRRTLDELVAEAKLSVSDKKPSSLSEAIETLSGGALLSDVFLDFSQSPSIALLEERVFSECGDRRAVERIRVAVVRAANASALKQIFETASEYVSSESMALAGETVAALSSARELFPEDARDLVTAVEEALVVLSSILKEGGRGAALSSLSNADKKASTPIEFLGAGDAGTMKNEEKVSDATAAVEAVLEASEKILKDRRAKLLRNDGGVVETLVEIMSKLKKEFKEKLPSPPAKKTKRTVSRKTSRVSTVLDEAGKQLPPKLELWASRESMETDGKEDLVAAVG